MDALNAPDEVTVIPFPQGPLTRKAHALLAHVNQAAIFGTPVSPDFLFRLADEIRVLRDQCEEFEGGTIPMARRFGGRT